MIFKGQNNEFIHLQSIDGSNEIFFDKELSFPLLFLWTLDEITNIKFEGTPFQLKKNTILCLTEFHKIEFKDVNIARLIKFNREFYCVLDHDKEVSCRGILFYGANQLPFFQIPEDELEKFDTLWKMFGIEMQSKDELQLEMLQTMLKRFIILCTRIYKSQNNFHLLEDKEIDIVKDFNFLVEQHFKTKHTVQEYADMLNKSPKTLSNLFAKLSEQTPLQIIHNRKLIEARRLLKYSNYSIKEIAYELGFEDIQTFSRFFKKLEKITPSEFKNQD